MDETLHVNKFEDADFKFDISFLKFQLKFNTQLRYFWSKFKDFYFWAKFCLKKFEGADLKKPQYSSFFEFQPENTQIKQFWFYILKSFFCKKYYILTN